MDLIELSRECVKKQLEELNKYIDSQQAEQGNDLDMAQTQNIIEAAITDKDKDLDRILDQQAYIKMIIERDGRIKSLKKTIAEDTRAIEQVRKMCAQASLKALKDRQDLIEGHTRDLERYQVHQIKSIAEDYQRLQNILQQRKKDIESLRRETELEEKNRGAFLEDVRKKLDIQLQERIRMRQGGASVDELFNQAISEEARNPNHLELTSIDEHYLYGTTSGEASTSTGRRGGRGGGGEGSSRGRKRGRGGAGQLG